MDEFKRFVIKRVIIVIILTISVLWVIGTITGFFGRTKYEQTFTGPNVKTVDTLPETFEPETFKPEENHHNSKKDTDILQPRHNISEPDHTKMAETPVYDNSAAPGANHTVLSTTNNIKGVAFVTAAIQPLSYELNQRFWGWRPNDILNFTDNINNFQLGVLEATRRTAVILAERIARTGSSASFDINLERAMNWFMIKAESYWFPSPESKYRAGLKNLEAYMEKLKAGKASFYNRADNLVPLLESYENLLGSCDEKLVTQKEEDGSDVGFFKADNYFYYAKGTASALLIMLKAIEKDFYQILYSRNALIDLHHAIEMCHLASEIEPWIIIDSDFDGIFANHRANMAARISHARFYIGVIVQTLST